MLFHYKCGNPVFILLPIKVCVYILFPGGPLPGLIL